MKPKLFVSASQYGVTEVGLRRKNQANGSRKPPDEPARSRWKESAHKELAAYFVGRGTCFSTRCDLSGLSPFTRAVLRITAKIPYGEVRSYEWVARKLGKPRAVRAVGNALARNPIPIIIPCHRIVRSDGTIGGFALGTAWKRRLLALERKFRNASQ